jgi:hypothetical protein
MIFMTLVLLLSFTSFNSLNAMGWWWTDADYQKHTVFAMAYATNGFKLEQQKEPMLVYSPGIIAFSWSIPEAQKAFNTILTNKYAGFPKKIKKQFIQDKKNEEAMATGNYPENSSQTNSPQPTAATTYNVISGYLQWQIKQDEEDTRPYADDAIKNRKDLRKALLEKNIELLKEVQNRPTVNEQDVNTLIGKYTKEEAEQAIKSYKSGWCLIS